MRDKTNIVGRFRSVKEGKIHNGFPTKRKTIYDSRLEKILLFKIIQAPENTNHYTAKMAQVGNSAEQES